METRSNACTSRAGPAGRRARGAPRESGRHRPHRAHRHEELDTLFDPKRLNIFSTSPAPRERGGGASFRPRIRVLLADRALHDQTTHKPSPARYYLRAPWIFDVHTHTRPSTRAVSRGCMYVCIPPAFWHGGDALADDDGRATRRHTHTLAITRAHKHAHKTEESRRDARRPRARKAATVTNISLRVFSPSAADLLRVSEASRRRALLCISSSHISIRTRKTRIQRLDSNSAI